MKFYDDINLDQADLTVTATVTNRATGAKTTIVMAPDADETTRYVLQRPDNNPLAASSYSYTARDGSGNVVGDSEFDVDANGDRITLRSLAANSGGPIPQIEVRGDRIAGGQIS